MAHQFQQKQVKKEATKQAKSNDNKTPMQNQEIFQMRWEANMAMQRQEEHTGTTEGQNNLAQLKEEDELQAKSAPTQFFVSEEEQEKKPMQAKVAQKAGSEEEELMQGKFAQKKSAPENDSSPTLGGTTTKMSEDVQAKMEGSFGTDFSNVNIHANDPSARQMGALAYTQGNDISFANGQYNPSTQSGQELLGHELTHVVQQRQGRVQPTKQGKGLAINDSPTLENEADAMGKQAAQGKSADVTEKGSGVQKQAGETYTVPAGWGLAKIAKHLGVTVEALKQANSDKLKTWGNVQGFNSGEVINIPATNSEEVQTPALEKTNQEIVNEALKNYKKGIITMPAMARTLKSYATTEANLVIEVLNQLQWYEQDNLAYSLAANSTDSDLAAFNRALLQKMSSSLSGWFNTLSGDANAKQNNRILKIISPQQNTTTDDKKSVAKKAQEDLILLRTHFNNNLTAGVGSGKPNKKVDVQLVSRGLQAKGYTVASSALNDGLCDDTFIDVIKKFQEEVVGSASPDGAVDAKGATLKKLFDKSNNSYSSGLSNMYGQSSSVLNASLEGNPLKTWKRSETFNTATNNYDYTINNTNFLDQETYKQHIEDLAKAKGVEEGSDNANVLGMAAKAASEPEYFNELTKGVGFELNLSQETVGSHQVNSVLKSRLTKFHKFMSAVGLFRGEMSGSACRDAAYAHLISVAHVVMGGVRPAASQQSVRNNLIKVFNGETVAGGSKASNGNILDSDGHVWAKSDHFNKNSAGTATSMKDADWYPHLKTPQPNRNWATLTAEGYERGDTKRFPLGLQATPGRSNHITGDAIDVNSGNFVNKNEAMIDLIALNFGIMRPVPGEQWHFECTNVQLSSSEKSLVDANTRETLSTP